MFCMRTATKRVIIVKILREGVYIIARKIQDKDKRKVSILIRIDEKSESTHLL